MLVFLVLVAVGLPLLAGPRGGLGVFATPSAGFLVGFPVAAYVVGLITERGGAPYSLRWGIAANILGGVGVLYIFGIAGIALLGRVSLAHATTLVWLFVPGDLAKAVIAAVIAKGVHAGYPGLLAHRRRDSHQPTSV